MSLLKQFKRLIFIDYLIRKRATVILETFAKKNLLSKPGMSNILHDMKALGFAIKFCRKTNTYYYDQTATLKRPFFESLGPLSENDKYQLGKISLKDLCFSDTVVFMKC